MSVNILLTNILVPHQLKAQSLILMHCFKFIPADCMTVPYVLQQFN